MARLLGIVPAQSLPLFTWPEQAQAADLNRERVELLQRIAKLPPMSHRRVVLQAHLRELTARQLRIESRLLRGLA